MRSLALLGALFAVLVLAVAWKLLGTSEDAPQAAEGPRDEGVLVLGVPESEPAAASPTTATPTTRQTTTPSPAPESRTQPAATPKATPTPNAGPRVVYHMDEPEPPPRERDLLHTVRPGESLYRIIELAYGRYSKRIQDAIVARNELSDPSKIKIGDSLRLPVVEGYPAPVAF